MSQTVDLGHGGVALAAGTNLPLGAPVKLMVTLPIVAQNRSVLMLRGRVVRSDAARTAVRITSRMFRTVEKGIGAGGR